MKKKPEYVQCPRCELNYFIIQKKRKYCDVCLAELGEVDPSILIPDDDEIAAETLCPVCKANFMLPGEAMCFLCAKERTSVVDAEDVPISDSWVEMDTFETDGMEVIPLEMLEEEEAAEDDEYYDEDADEELDEDFDIKYSDDEDDDFDDLDEDDDEDDK